MNPPFEPFLQVRKKRPLVVALLPLLLLLLLLLMLGLQLPGCQASIEKVEGVGSDSTKVYALYFPQFYADPLNDRLWGDGFTDWNNLKAAPKINKYGSSIAVPTELGYYNLLDVNVRRQQRELATQYGIDGFIYHHYWFHHENEGASLSGVIEALLADGEPALPFAFNWAKDSWVTTWHSAFSDAFHPDTNRTLVQQLLPSADDIRIDQHYAFLRRFFLKPQYIKVNGAPLFSIYGGNPLDPALLAVLQRMKQLAIEDGFPSPGLHIPMMQRMSKHSLYTAQFPPPRFDFTLAQQAQLAQQKQQSVAATAGGVYDAVLYYPFNDSPQRQMKMPPLCRAELHSSNPLPAYVAVNSVFDNTPRRSVEGAHVYNRSFGGERVDPPTSFHLDVLTALLYDKCCIQSDAVRQRGGKYMMVNAWNEWGEGMVLEPSDKYGRKLLEAVFNAKSVAAGIGCDWQQYDEYMLQYVDSLLYTPEEVAAAGVAHYGHKYHTLLNKKAPTTSTATAAVKSIADYYPPLSEQQLAELDDDDALEHNDDFEAKWRGKKVPENIQQMRDRISATSTAAAANKKQQLRGHQNKAATVVAAAGGGNIIEISAHKRDVLYKVRMDHQKRTHHHTQQLQ